MPGFESGNGVNDRCPATSPHRGPAPGDGASEPATSPDCGPQHRPTSASAPPDGCPEADRPSSVARGRADMRSMVARDHGPARRQDVHPHHRNGREPPRRGGGVRLVLDPSAITMGDVMRAMEDDFAVVECLGPARFCRIAGVCGARSVFAKALDSYFTVLDGATLDDMAANDQGLRGALDLISHAGP